VGCRGIVDTSEPAVENVVSIVADERTFRRLAEHRMGTELSETPLAQREPEGNDLHGEGSPHTETLDDLFGADDDHQALRRCRNDLFAYEGAAEALDEIETRIDFVCAVDREVELADFAKRRETKTEALRESTRRLGGRHADYPHPLAHPTCQRGDELHRSVAGSKTDLHPILDVSSRRLSQDSQSVFPGRAHRRCTISIR